MRQGCIYLLTVVFLLLSAVGHAADESAILKRLERLEQELEESKARERVLNEKIRRLEENALGEQPNAPQVKPEVAKDGDRQIEWKHESPFKVFDRTFGSDLPPDPASKQTQNAHSETRNDLTETLRKHEAEFYRDGTLRERILGGFDFQGFVDARFVFDEDILFDQIESFNFRLQEVELDVMKRFPKYAFMRADLDIETTSTTNVSLEQAYVGLTVPFLLNSDFYFGRFNSPIGSEHQDAPNRRFINRSLVHELGLPDNFTGLMFKVPVWQKDKDGKLGTFVYFIVANGWDIYDDVNDNKTLAGRLEIVPVPEFALGISGGGGSERQFTDSLWRRFLNIDAVWTPHPKWDFNFDFNFGYEDMALVGFLPNGQPFYTDANWWGTQGTALYRMFRWLDFALRYEVFRDGNGARIIDNPGVRSLVSRFISQSVFVQSVSGNFAVHLTEGADLNIEYQYNNGEGQIFLDQVGTLDAHENVVTFQFVYVF